MGFEWNFSTLLALFAGMAVGAGLQYYEDRQKSKRERRQKFCPHCGESLGI
jgi:hypothetical protein